MTVVQAVLLYGADSWVISERNMRKLEAFHRRAIQHMMGEHIRKVAADEWVHPDHRKLLFKCRLFPINT